MAEEGQSLDSPVLQVLWPFFAGAALWTPHALPCLILGLYGHPPRTPFAGCGLGQVCSLIHESYLPDNIAGSWLLWLIVITFLPEAVHFLICSHRFLV